MSIPDPGLDFLPIPDQGIREAPDPDTQHLYSDHPLRFCFVVQKKRAKYF
jgi:hypothetical protein